jgi:hypothetical protein
MMVALNTVLYGSQFLRWMRNCGVENASGSIRGDIRQSKQSQVQSALQNTALRLPYRETLKISQLESLNNTVSITNPFCQ